MSFSGPLCCHVMLPSQHTTSHLRSSPAWNVLQNVVNGHETLLLQGSSRTRLLSLPQMGILLSTTIVSGAVAGEVLYLRLWVCLALVPYIVWYRTSRNRPPTFIVARFWRMYEDGRAQIRDKYIWLYTLQTRFYSTAFLFILADQSQSVTVDGGIR